MASGPSNSSSQAKNENKRPSWNHNHNNNNAKKTKKKVSKEENRSNSQIKLLKIEELKIDPQYKNLVPRPTLAERLQYPLRVPEYCRKVIDQVISQGEECKIPYTVRVIKAEEHGYQIHITAESNEISLESWNKGNIAGIDLNPVGIAVAVASPDGNLIKTRFFKEPRLITASTNKRKNILGELVNKILNWVKKTNGCNLIVLEDLKFDGAYDSNSNNNRALSNFAKSKMIQAIKSRAIKQQIIVAEVDPRYSSSIALEKYARQFQGFQRHGLAGFIIARRALGYSEEPTMNYFEDHLKQIIAKKRKNKEDRKLLFMWKYCSSTVDFGYHSLSHILHHDPMERKSGTVTLDENQRILTKMVTPRPAGTLNSHEYPVTELSRSNNGEQGASIQVNSKLREIELEGTCSNLSVPTTNLIQTIGSRNVKQVQG